MRIQSDPKLNKKVYCCYSLDLRKYVTNVCTIFYNKRNEFYCKYKKEINIKLLTLFV